MDRRPASRTGADRPGEEREPATVLAGLRARLGGLGPSDEGGGGLTVEQLEAANVGASAQQIDALVALGILGRRVSGGEARLVWAWDRIESGEGEGGGEGELGSGTGVVAPESGQVDSRAEEFDVDLAADYEHERLLMYRVIIAFEIVVAIILIRELAPTFV